MRSVRKTAVCSAVALGSLFLLTSCDWSGGSDNSFNTRNGASGVDNISGFYQGRYSGGRAVESTTAGNIVHMTIQQDGNRVRVTDNQGSQYIGNVGSPFDLVSPTATDIPVGSNLAVYQVSWSGKDEVSQREVEFTGTIHLVAVSDIDGTVVDSTQTSSSSSSSTTSSILIEDNSTPDQVGPGGVEPGTTDIVTTEEEESSSREGTMTITDQVEFRITEQNSQFRLRGTWVEKGGKVSGVNATAPGAGAGTITSQFTRSTTTTE